MNTGIKWFVEIIYERRPEPRLEVCESLRAAREIAEQAAAEVDFEPTNDSIAIYRGEDWASAKLFE